MKRMQCTSLSLALSLFACAAPQGSSPRSAAKSRESDAQAWSAPSLERALAVHDGRTGEGLSLDQLFDRLASADVVFLGETHIDETTHRLELATYEALLARRPQQVVLAMEMFERDEQAKLDQYLAGAIDEPAFLASVRPWSNYRTAYRPLIERAKAARAPVVASNFPATLRAKMASEEIGALDKLSPDVRAQAPAKLFANTPLYWKRVDNAIRGHIGMMGPRAAADDPRLMDTQSLWDNCMGESCALALDNHPSSMVLHVNGGFHTEYWDGTARQLKLRKPNAKVLTVAIEPSINPEVDDVGGIPRADFVVFAEARAKDVNEGTYAVDVAREVKYRLHLPPTASDSQRVPLLIWLGDDGDTAKENLAEWQERVGENCAVCVLEAPYREIEEDLVEGGRWFWPDTFTEDVGTVQDAVDRTWSYLMRHYPIDATRVCLAGEGTGATVAAAVSMLGAIPLKGVALEPRRFAKIKDFALPLPELAGDGPKPAKSLRIVTNAGDREWWQGEVDEYRAIGFASEVVLANDDPYRADLERENEVRAGLGLDPRTAKADAARRWVEADGPRAKSWARRIALKRAKDAGELVAIVESAPSDANATEIPTAVHARDFTSKRALPLCPGPFGGSTVIALPSDCPQDEVDAWLALEKDDPLAKKSRFHRLRIATAGGERSLPNVLAQLLEKNRKNVLIVPATFCADGATMRALQRSVRDREDKMTLIWQPGLGSLGD